MNMDIHLRLDEQDLDRASRASGIADPAKLVEHVLKEYVQLKARMELLRMGGTGGACSLDAGCLPPVRRPPDFLNRLRDLEPPG